MPKKIILALTASSVLAMSSVAWGHHSAAMFDATKSVTIEGTVKQFDLTNPHAWLFVIVPGKDGAAPTEWSIEFGSPNHLYRQGFKASMLKPGDKVTVTMAPLRDGTAGGQFRKGTLGDGTPFGEKRATEL